MKTIKIIAGTFGYLPAGKNSVQLKDSQSDPFDVADAIADRLVLKGVAEHYAGSCAADPAAPPYNAEMTKKALVKYGASIGLELDEKATKDKLIAALDAATAEVEDPADGDPDNSDPDGDGDPDGADDGEAPPAVGASDPV